jgi:hypothetical protein
MSDTEAAKKGRPVKPACWGKQCQKAELFENKSRERRISFKKQGKVSEDFENDRKDKKNCMQTIRKDYGFSDYCVPAVLSGIPAGGFHCDTGIPAL